MLTDKLADCLKEPQKPLLEFQAIAVCISVLLLINIALSPWILRFRNGDVRVSGNQESTDPERGASTMTRGAEDSW